MPTTHKHSRIIYEIKVQGELDQSWETYFNGLAVRLSYTSEGSPTTTLTCPVVDQAALRGMLCKLWDLNLTVLSVRNIEEDGEREKGNG